jgi:cyclophilin family peptidyl-prolyl cis-trans isomerase
MVQNPGTKEYLKDKFSPELTHSKKGLLSTSNPGPDLNGSNFFITLGSCKDFDGKHSIFGEVMDGIDILEKINSTFVNEKHEPYQPVKILHTLIVYDPFSEDDY